MPLGKRDRDRLKVMNQHLYPATLRFREDTKAFFIDYRRGGRNVRQSLGNDIELSYERALLLRKELDSLPVITEREATLGQFYERYSAKKYTTLSPKTVAGYKYSWALIGPSLGARALPKITEAFAEEAVNRIAAPGARKNAGIFLCILLNAAAKDGLIPRNPYHPHFESRKRVVPVLSTENLLKLCDNVSDSAKPAVILAAFCGLRYGEIMALRRLDLDFDQGLLYVVKGRIRLYGKQGIDQIKETKTEEPRTLPLPSLAIKLLAPVLEGLNPTDMLYPVWRQDLDKRLAVAAKKAGLPRVTMHGLRHIVGSRIMMTDGVAAAQATLGHKDITTTVDTYGHLTAVYLKNKIELANIAPDSLRQAESLAKELTTHEDEKVRALASIAQQFCHVLARHS